jgi:hypothetical protein
LLVDDVVRDAPLDHRPRNAEVVPAERLLNRYSSISAKLGALGTVEEEVRELALGFADVAGLQTLPSGLLGRGVVPEGIEDAVVAGVEPWNVSSFSAQSLSTSALSNRACPPSVRFMVLNLPAAPQRAAVRPSTPNFSAT